eukprot:tig00000411_g555.t1
MAVAKAQYFIGQAVSFPKPPANLGEPSIVQLVRTTYRSISLEITLSKNDALDTVTLKDLPIGKCSLLMRAAADEAGTEKEAAFMAQPESKKAPYVLTADRLQSDTEYIFYAVCENKYDASNRSAAFSARTKAVAAAPDLDGIASSNEDGTFRATRPLARLLPRSKGRPASPVKVTINGTFASLPTVLVGRFNANGTSTDGSAGVPLAASVFPVPDASDETNPIVGTSLTFEIPATPPGVSSAGGRRLLALETGTSYGIKIAAGDDVIVISDAVQWDASASINTTELGVVCTFNATASGVAVRTCARASNASVVTVPSTAVAGRLSLLLSGTFSAAPSKIWLGRFDAEGNVICAVEASDIALEASGVRFSTTNAVPTTACSRRAAARSLLLAPDTTYDLLALQDDGERTIVKNFITWNKKAFNAPPAALWASSASGGASASAWSLLIAAAVAAAPAVFRGRTLL